MFSVIFHKFHLTNLSSMKNLPISLILVLLLLNSCIEPAEKPKEYRIAYNILWDRENDNYEVFTMKMDGSDHINITNSPGVEWVYYANEDKVYVISDKDTTHRHYFLYETDGFGKSTRKMINQRLNDSWLSSRKKGTEFIVDPRVAGDSAFYIYDHQGNLLSKLYTGLAYYNDPYFSPDGQQIVFRGAEKKFKKDNGFIDELYIINTDGSDIRQLTHYPESDTLAKWWEYHAGPPFWEPNRNVITYNSVQDGYSSLFLTTPDGKSPERITPDTLTAGWHAWSSDGKWIVFDGQIRNAKKTNYDIYLMEFESRLITRLTSDSTFEQAPVFVEVKSAE